MPNARLLLPWLAMVAVLGGCSVEDPCTNLTAQCASDNSFEQCLSTGDPEIPSTEVVTHVCGSLEDSAWAEPPAGTVIGSSCNVVHRAPLCTLGKQADPACDPAIPLQRLCVDAHTAIICRWGWRTEELSCGEGFCIPGFEQDACALSASLDVRCPAGEGGYCDEATFVRCAKNFRVELQDCTDPSLCRELDSQAACVQETERDERCTETLYGGMRCDGESRITCLDGFLVEEKFCESQCKELATRQTVACD